MNCWPSRTLKQTLRQTGRPSNGIDWDLTTMPDLLSCSCPGRLEAPFSRRDLLKSTADGFGLVALSALMSDRAYAEAGSPGANAPGSPRPHFKPRARNVIFCFMDGGVSHVDSFDPKPGLDKNDGKDRKSTRLNSSHIQKSRMPSSA